MVRLSKETEEFVDGVASGGSPIIGIVTNIEGAPVPRTKKLLGDCFQSVVGADRRFPGDARPEAIRNY